MSSWIIYVIGFTAQILFSSRLLIQWIASEKQKRVITQLLFWEISLVASVLLFLYGYLRHDFAIMLGQVITYYIYIRNIQLQNAWNKYPFVLRWFVYLLPAVLGILSFYNNTIDVDNLFRNEKIPAWLILLGSVAQVTFTLRFVYQWIYSERRKESVLPMGFWILSLAGSLLIFVYGIIRKDPVLLAGHCMGLIIYTRNIILSYKNPVNDAKT